MVKKRKEGKKKNSEIRGRVIAVDKKFLKKKKVRHKIMKKACIKKKKSHKKISRGQYLSWKEIKENIKAVSDEKKIVYLKRVLIKPEFLQEKTKRQVCEFLGNLDIEAGNIKDANKNFRNARDNKMALNCSQVIHTFTEKDEKELEEYKRKLEELEGKILPSHPPIPPKEIDDFSKSEESY